MSTIMICILDVLSFYFGHDAVATALSLFFATRSRSYVRVGVHMNPGFEVSRHGLGHVPKRIFKQDH